MKVAVLGVGLIGGSIGLAARAHGSDAEVAGFDPDRELLGARCRARRDRRRRRLGRGGVRGGRARLLRAPVGALPAWLREALDAAGADCVVTDVGSTKREIVAELGEDERFIGGHPLAGAETAGVENARAELFEGAAGT